MQTSWRDPTTFEELLVQLRKSLTSQQRRAAPMSAQDLLGPGMAVRAIQIGDWNDPAILLNGNYYSTPGALHGPDTGLAWTGSVIARANGTGMQQVWNTDDLDNVRYFMRTYVADITGQGATFSDWRHFATPSGYVDFENLNPAVQTQLNDMEDALDLILPELMVYRQDTAPTDPDSLGRDLLVGDQWLDTDDGNHPYVWDGTIWADYATSVLGDIPDQIAAAQALAEAAAAAAADAMDFAVTLTKVYRQNSAPSNPDADGRALVADDVWFDQDDANRMYTWSGSAWVLLAIATEGYAADAATAAQVAAIAAAAITSAAQASAAQSAAISAAATDATTKAAAAQAAAIAAASTDATTKANAAQAAAISAAAADATTKAGNAQSAAIAAAATDATTKAAAAQAAAIGVANTKAAVFRQSSTPTSLQAGDIWFDTGHDNAIYRAFAAGVNTIGSSAWVLTQIGLTAIADDSITSAKIVANTIQTTDLVATAIDGMTVTGATLQTVVTAARGIKINSTGLTAYNGSGVATLSIVGATGAITMLGDLTSGSTVTGATVTGGTLQSEATAARGVKITSGGLTAYNGSGVAQFTIDAATGSVALAGAITGAGTITGPVFQTSASATVGIKINGTNLIAYNASNAATFTITAATGAIAMTGPVLTGGSITGGTVTGGTVQSEVTAARGIKITSANLIAYNGSGVAQVTIDATTGGITLAGAITGAGTITGPTFQTSASANTGIKISSAGLIGYNGTSAVFTLNATTGAIIATGAISSGSTIDGSVVTGGTVQTEATAARGIKINSSGLAAYNTSGVAQFTIDATTGSLILAGSMTGGGTITGPVFQTSAAASTGIKITSTGLAAYNASGVPTIVVDASTGFVTITGGLVTGGDINGASFTGGLLQTEGAAARGVKINSSGFVSYDSVVGSPTLGQPTFVIDAATGAVAMTGRLTATSMTVLDNGLFLGTSTLSGTIKAASGVPDPTAAPTFTNTYPAVVSAGVGGSAALPNNGAVEDAAGTYLIMNKVLVDNVSTSITWVNKTTGACTSTTLTDTGAIFYSKTQSLTRIGTTLYGLWRDASAGWKIWTQTITGVGTLTTPATSGVVLGLTGFAGNPVIGNDATNLLLCYCSGTVNIVIQPLNPTTFATTGTVKNLTTGAYSNAGIFFVGIGNYDYGASRTLVGYIAGGIGGRLDHFNSSNVYQSAEGWPIDTSHTIAAGVIWDGTNFWSVERTTSLTPAVTKYSSGRTVDSAVFGRYTWYDAVGTTHETANSPATASFTWKARAHLTMTASPAPEAALSGADSANLIRMYVGASAGATKLQTSPAQGVVSQTWETINAASAAPPTTTGFTGGIGAVGSLESTTFTTGSVGWKFKGDGSAQVGWETWDTSGNRTDTTPYAKRRQNVNLNVTSGNPIAWDTAVSSSGGMTWGGSGNWWTVPRAGLYLVTSRIGFLTLAGQFPALSVVVNGGVVSMAYKAPDQQWNEITDIIRCSAGDQVAVWASKTGGGTVNLEGGSDLRAYASIAWIGP